MGSSLVLEILILSSTVSLATLGALLYRRIKPTQLSIPTFEYGSTHAAPRSKLALSKPPLLLWLLVALITAAYCIVYFRDDSAAIENSAAMQSTVWIDKSVSSMLTLKADQAQQAAGSSSPVANSTRLESPEVPQEILQKLSEFKGSLRFADSKIEWDANEKIWYPKVNFIPAQTGTEIAAVFRELSSHGFSPFSLELSAEALRNAFLASEGSAEMRGRLIVVTDGQRSSNQGLAQLKDIFSEIVVLPLPQRRPIALPQAEIVPRSLRELWVGGRSSNEGSADFVDYLTMPGAENLSVETEIEIPEDARPGLLLGQLLPEDSLTANMPAKSAIFRNTIFSASSELAAGQDQLGQPSNKLKSKRSTLFTHCSSIPSGPTELNPLADLQALVRFFDIKMRSIDCKEFSSNPTNQTFALDMNDPWAYRKASMWLVPLRKKVYNTMLYQQQLFIPHGFRSASDSLFYYADPSPQEYAAEVSTDLGGQAEEFKVRQVAVQVEENQTPAALFLAPPPPQGKLDVPTDTSSKTSLKVFQPFVSAHDSTPLVYRFHNSNIFYLRTTLAMPNGELGRTGFWPSFWLEALQGAAMNRGGLVIHRSAEPSKLDLPDPTELDLLDVATLKFEQAPQHYSLGLYRHKATGVLHLVEPANEERDGQFLSEYEIAGLVATSDARKENQSEKLHNPQKSQLHVLLGATAGLLGLLLYWYRLAQQEKNQQSKTNVLVFILAAAGSLLHDSRAQAQPLAQNPTIQLPSGLPLPNMGQGFQDARLPERINVPFRMAWCSEKDRAKVEAGYHSFREMLQNRGTIHLQKELQFGTCYPGGAEIWWTNSFDDLDPSFLKEHVQSGGTFVVEGASESGNLQRLMVPKELASLEEPSIGLKWERPEKRGLLYRSFYLLQTFDGCAQDNTLMLTLRKKQTAKSPVAVVTSASFFSGKADCFNTDTDYRMRSFVNLMYALLTTDYKEDQLQLPELLRRVRNLGLEP